MNRAKQFQNTESVVHLNHRQTDDETQTLNTHEHTSIDTIKD